MTTEDRHKRIASLMERFFDGATSLSEERELYDFFASDDIPAELEHCRPLFRYFAQEMPRELAADRAVPRSGRRRIFRLRVAGVAAAVAALIAIGVAIERKSRVGDNRFAESYIIRNGVKITDPKIVRQELQGTLRLFEEQEPRANAADRKRAIYEEVISRFPDEYTREVVRRKLYIQ